MLWFVIAHASVVLLLGKKDWLYKSLCLTIISYCLLVIYSNYYNITLHVLFNTTLIILPLIYILQSKNKNSIWCYLSVVWVKVVEILFLIFPQHITPVQWVLFKADYIYLGGIIYMITSDVVGYDILNMNYDNTKKFIIGLLFTYIVILSFL